MSDSTDTNARPQQLRSVLFEQLDEEERRKIAAACRWRRYDKGNMVLAQREQSDDVLFLHQGTVRVTMCSGSGRQVTYRDLHDGDLIAELAAIDHKPRSAEVIAVTDCVIASMPARRFIELLTHTPALALWELRRLTSIVRDLSDRQLELVALPLQTRLCAYLLRLAADANDDDTSSLVPLPKHEEIANIIGSQREAVTKAFRDLEKRGLVERKGQQALIHVQQLRSVLDAAI